jgi:hypothetical protein
MNERQNMIPTSQPIQTCHRFNAIRCHDSELRSVLVNYLPTEPGPKFNYQVILRVDLSTAKGVPIKEAFVPIEVRFVHTRYFQTDLDLLGVGYCGGDISHAECFEEPAFKRQISQAKISQFDLPQEVGSWAGLKHFHVYLCDSSGQINIIAQDFEIRNLPASNANDGRTITVL